MRGDTPYPPCVCGSSDVQKNQPCDLSVQPNVPSRFEPVFHAEFGLSRADPCIVDFGEAPKF